MGRRSMTTTGSDKPRSYSGDYMELGRKGSNIVLDWLCQRPQVIGVIDWRDVKVVQEIDVDFAIKTRDGRIVLAEVKTDSHLGVSGNVLFEVLRLNHRAPLEHCLTLGWGGRSPAQYFLLYAPVPHVIYQCKAADFRQVFQSYTGKTRKQTRLTWVNTDDVKSTLNVLIPWKYCKDIFTIHRLPGKEQC
jgi:hypothetical protein